MFSYQQYTTHVNRRAKLESKYSFKHGFRTAAFSYIFWSRVSIAVTSWWKTIAFMNLRLGHQLASHAIFKYAWQKGRMSKLVICEFKLMLWYIFREKETWCLNAGRIWTPTRLGAICIFTGDQTYVYIWRSCVSSSSSPLLKAITRSRSHSPDGDVQWFHELCPSVSWMAVWW